MESSDILCRRTFIMGDPNRQPYFQVEGRGLVRLISLIVAIFAAYPVFNMASRVWNHGFRYAFHGDWADVISVLGMLVIVMVAGSVALKGKFSIP
jgi:uncharacterized membrane protein